MNLLTNPYISFKQSASSKAIIEKNRETLNILEDKDVTVETKLNIIEKEVGQALDKAETYLNKASQEKTDYKTKNRLANKGLSYVDKAEMNNKRYKYIAKDNTTGEDRAKKVQIHNSNKARITSIRLQLLQQANAINADAPIKQMSDLYYNRLAVLDGRKAVAKLSDDFEKGFVFTYKPFYPSGVMKLTENDDIGKEFLSKVRINLEDDKVLVEASKKLNKNLKNTDKSASINIAKALLETETDFFKPKLITNEYEKNGIIHTSKHNENGLIMNGKFIYYSDYKQKKYPCRIVDIGEFSTGSMGLPASVATCLVQSMFLKATAQLSGINTTLMINKDHSWLEYNAEDGKKFIIDVRNKYIFDLADKKGLYFNMYKEEYKNFPDQKMKDSINNLYNQDGNVIYKV
ncbi:MAG: hypothetical protein WCK67_12245 [bacterium]